MFKFNRKARRLLAFVFSVYLSAVLIYALIVYDKAILFILSLFGVFFLMLILLSWADVISRDIDNKYKQPKINNNKPLKDL